MSKSLKKIVSRVGAAAPMMALCLSTAMNGMAYAAAPYPNRPIKVIVPFTPGGPTDFACRLAAQKLTESIGQSVVVDNRAGAGGIIGAQAAAQSPNDGYTLFCASTSTMAIAPAMHDKLGYDPIKSFAAVSMIAKSPMVLAVSPKLKVNTLQELIALARSKPGMLHYGSAGVGTPPHLAAELFKTLAGIDIVHVPYKGASLAMNDVISGQIEMVFESPATLLPFVQSGQVKALVVTSTDHAQSLPSIPSSKDAGLPDLQVSSWNGFVAPAGTPPDILETLSRHMKKDLDQPDVKAALGKYGLEVGGSTPREFGAFIQAELDRWSPIARNFKSDAN
jgi:tripartite-type tricarboxylate transporter receptor subunit TctC